MESYRFCTTGSSSLDGLAETFLFLVHVNLAEILFFFLVHINKKEKMTEKVFLCVLIMALTPFTTQAFSWGDKVMQGVLTNSLGAQAIKEDYKKWIKEKHLKVKTLVFAVFKCFVLLFFCCFWASILFCFCFLVSRHVVRHTTFLQTELPLSVADSLSRHFHDATLFAGNKGAFWKKTGCRLRDPIHPGRH